MSIDIQVAKEAARGHWSTIANRVIGIPDDYLTTKQGPCPKCKCGTDRWRVYKDFDETGGAMCNQCGKSADGFALAQWYLDCSLNEAIEKVCQFLGVEDSKAKKRKRGPARVVSTKPDSIEESKPAKNLPITLRPWNDKHFGMCFANKKPITMEAVKLAGGTVAKHYGDTVMAFPCIGRDGQPSGWAMYNINGGTIKYRPSEDEPYQDLKIKLIGCQGGGWIGRINPNRTEDPIFKVEGVSDMLTILSANPEASVITNANGAGQDPLHKERQWMLEVFRDRIVYTIHDQDDQGQDGATWTGTDVRKRPGWAVAISLVAKESRNVNLPFPMNSKNENEKDVRDFFNDRLDKLDTMAEAFQELVKIAAEAPVIVHPDGYRLADPESDSDQSFGPTADTDDPHRLAMMNLAKYSDLTGGTLKYWRDEWWKWKKNKWKNISHKDLNAKVTKSIKEEFDTVAKQQFAQYLESKSEDKKPPRVLQVRTSLVNNVLNAMAGESLIPASVELETWLDGRTKKRYLSMANGILDIEAFVSDSDEVIIPHSPNWFSTSCLDYAFDTNAECPRWIKYLDYCMEGDNQRIRVLQEFMGYVLYPSTKFQKFLALEGKGGNGKSVFMAAIEAVIGKMNISNVGLQRFNGQFDLFQTLGKMVNISGDVGELDAVAEGVLKEYTGGDSMSFDRKNRDPITARPTAKLILSWNNRPVFHDRSNAIWRRMILVPFNLKVEESKIVYGMSDPAWWLESGEVPGILNWALVGLTRLLEQNKFTDSIQVNSAIETYKGESNLIRRFLLDRFIEDPEECLKSSEIYKEYASDAIANGNKNPRNSAVFGREVCGLFPTVVHKRKQHFGDRDYYYIGLRRKEEKDYGSEDDSVR